MEEGACFKPTVSFEPRVSEGQCTGEGQEAGNAGWREEQEVSREGGWDHHSSRPHHCIVDEEQPRVDLCYLRTNLRRGHCYTQPPYTTTVLKRRAANLSSQTMMITVMIV